MWLFKICRSIDTIICRSIYHTLKSISILNMIIIEGIIGAGKSYVCKALTKSFPDLHIEEELVDTDWKTSRLYNLNMLDLRYKCNTSSLAQMYILLSFDNSAHKIVTERSIYSAYHVFSKMTNPITYQDKIMDECYHKYYNTIVRSLPQHEIVFLDVDPEICLNNIRTRGRPEEQSLDLDMLREQRSKYINMLDVLDNVHVVYNTDDCIRFIGCRLNEQVSRHIWN
jgi:deoxyadenosine/deoxycytidine kinase